VRDKGVAQLLRTWPLNGNYARDPFPLPPLPFRFRRGKRFCRIKCIPLTSSSASRNYRFCRLMAKAFSWRIENASEKGKTGSYYKKYSRSIHWWRIFTLRDRKKSTEIKNFAKLGNYVKESVGGGEGIVSFLIPDWYRTLNASLLHSGNWSKRGFALIIQTRPFSPVQGNGNIE
jgi:hypothetical protein